jgi:hypothetical protein
MKLAAAILQPAAGSHTVRVIKAADAATLLPSEKKDHVHSGPRKPSEVRLVATGADYCDLEFVCGCGEVTRFRCWNAPADGKAAAA